MEKQDFNRWFLTDKMPEEVFNAINNVTAWWTENLTGASQKLNDEFAVHFADVHYSRHRIVELIAGQKVVWLVADSKLTFVDKQTEWTGTHNIFEISRQGDKTRVAFTHAGLIPDFQCYNGCSSGWTYYINSLQQLIDTGVGTPDKQEVVS